MLSATKIYVHAFAIVPVIFEEVWSVDIYYDSELVSGSQPFSLVFKVVSC